MDQYTNFNISFRGDEYQPRGASNETNPGENISDNGGIRAALRAFKSLKETERNNCVPGFPFSGEQLFWVMAYPE